MTREEAIKVLLDEWKCIDRNDGINCDRKCEKCDLVMDSAILKEAYNMAIKALEQEPCDDVVSRQAIMKLKRHNLVEGQFVSLYDIEQLPSVRPQEQTGHWIKGEEWCETVDGFERWGNDYTCSECGLSLGRYTLTDFCPNCGAKMESEE